MKKINFVLMSMFFVIMLASCSADDSIERNLQDISDSLSNYEEAAAPTNGNTLIGIWEWYGKIDEFDRVEEYADISGRWQFKENGEVEFNDYIFDESSVWQYEVTEDKNLIMTNPNEDIILIGNAIPENDTIYLMEYYEKRSEDKEKVTKDDGSEVLRKQYQMNGKTYIEDDDGYALRKTSHASDSSQHSE